MATRLTILYWDGCKRLAAARRLVLLPRTDLSGDDGCRTESDGVVESIEESREARKGKQIVDGDILGKGLTG